MPLWTCVMFGFGLGLGAAWKAGAIPIEIGTARTGQIAAPEATSDINPVSADSLDADEIVPASVTVATVDDAAIFEQQTEPSETETASHSNRPALLNATEREEILLPTPSVITRPASPEQVSGEPAWATSPTPARATGGDTASNEPVMSIRQTARDAGAIRQAGHREPATTPTKTTSVDSPFAADLQAIDEQIANGETLAAHRALSKMYWNNKSQRGAIQARLDGTAKAIFFQPQPHFVEPYVIEPNDQLRAVAGKYQLSWEYLAKLNKTDPRRIQPGQKLKVVKGPFSAIVDLQDFALTVHLQGYYVKRYDVGIGKEGSSPVGKFSVLNKVENPQYTGPDGKVISADDPTNPLGERWVDLGDSYGIHGTIDPDSIGQAASRGCIRLRDKDVIEVYDFLVKGSEVVIRQ